MALQELTERLPQGKSGASRLGTRLAAEGLLRKEKDGRTVRYYTWPWRPMADPNREILPDLLRLSTKLPMKGVVLVVSGESSWSPYVPAKPISSSPSAWSSS